MVSRRNKVVRRPKGSMNRNRAIAQQVGQRERRLARFLSSMSLAAAALPWTFCHHNVAKLYLCRIHLYSFRLLE